MTFVSATSCKHQSAHARYAAILDRSCGEHFEGYTAYGASAAESVEAKVFRVKRRRIDTADEVPTDGSHAPLC